MLNLKRIFLIIESSDVSLVKFCSCQDVMRLNGCRLLLYIFDYDGVELD